MLVVIAVSAVVPASAQTPSLTYSYFERYLESYREQYGIPALSAVVLQGGQEIGRSGLGRQDVEGNVSARADTAYFIGNLSQIFGSTLLLKKCYDQDTLELTDNVIRWVPGYADASTTVGQLLTHQSTGGTYVYDPQRYASLTDVVEECADLTYRHVLASEVFAHLAMTRSVPGRALDGVQNPGGGAFSAAELARYNDLLLQMAKHYRLDRGQAIRTAVPPVAADASTGAISTALDLPAFDNALRVPNSFLSRDATTLAWTQAGNSMPTGLGWFVQNYNNEPLVWQFDLTRDVASSLIVKLPARDLTFIVLANSDGLTRTSNLSTGNALSSPFVQLFLRFFAP